MKNNILNIARPDLINMAAYRSARSEQMQGKIWLDANESPWDNNYNRYPEPQPRNLISLLSKIYKVDSEKILLTRGSDEGIDLLLRSFCCYKKDSILICPPTYGMYAIAATIQGAEIIKIPLLKEKDFSLDLQKILNMQERNIKLIFLCSPNNPTGNLIEKDSVLKIAREFKSRALVVVDEAYVEFSENESLSKYIDIYPNIVVLRTLSKAYGLAGVRCGAVIADIEIIQLLRKVIAAYPISKPVIDIISEKLVKLDYFYEKVDLIKKERNRIRCYLESLSFVRKVWPSDTNFLLLEVDNAEKIINLLHKHEIVVRNRNEEFNLNNCIRITIGMPNENDALMEALSYV